MKPKRRRNPSKSGASESDSATIDYQTTTSPSSARNSQQQKSYVIQDNGATPSRPFVTSPGTPDHGSNSDPLCEQELRERISKVISNDPSFLQSIIEPIASLVSDKIINTSCSQIIDKLAENLLKNKTFITSIADSVKDAIAQEIYEATTIDTAKHADELSLLSQKYKEISTLNRNLTDNLDDLEQYSRRNCLLLHGIKESSDEKTDQIVIQIINDKLHLNLQPGDIDRSHRLGQSRKRPNMKPRSIIIKFVSYRSRSTVFKNKRLLKGSGLVITENLTRRRNELLKAAKACPYVEAAWSMDGRIILLRNDKKTSISSMQELEKYTS